MGTTRQEGSSCSRWSRRTDGARAAATRALSRNTHDASWLLYVRIASCRVTPLDNSSARIAVFFSE